MSIKPLPFKNLKVVPLAKRQIESDGVDYAAPFMGGSNFSDFLCSLPNLGCAGDLFRLRDAIVTAKRNGKQVILACGEHAFDTGLSPLISRMIELRIVTGLALTGAALEQDVEISMLGQTVKSADQELLNGRYCTTDETGQLINDAIVYGNIEGWGIGKSVGHHLMEAELEHLDHSAVATAVRYGIPLTVHPAIGADAFVMHPACDGEALGAAGLVDMRLLAAMLAESNEGVVINIASSVLPRILLQALDAARNLGNNVGSITSAVIDPRARSAAIHDMVISMSHPHGKGYWLSGPDEVLIPLLFASVIDALSDEI